MQAPEMVAEQVLGGAIISPSMCCTLARIACASLDRLFSSALSAATIASALTTRDFFLRAF